MDDTRENQQETQQNAEDVSIDSSGKQKGKVSPLVPGTKEKRKEKPSKRGGFGMKMPQVGPGNFWNNVLSTLLLLLLVTAVYSYIANRIEAPKEISVSEIAGQVKAGEVKEIVIEGNTIKVTYVDEKRVKAEAKKENDAAVTETLTSLGVTAEELSKISIDVQNETGLRFWLLSLAPFLFPLLVLGFVAWFFLRQVRGAGMQALNFGSSKARIIDPNDQNQRVTFDDVAGAKEAKEELKEIVDFLRNPKKFLDIGAQIPKGVLLMGAPGTGKCVTGDTLIMTGKGLVRIEDVPLSFSLGNRDTVEGLTVASLDPKTLKLAATEASHWYDLGIQDTKRVVTDIGLAVEGTHEHPIVVVDQTTGNLLFKPLAEIEEGEWAVSAYDTQLFGRSTLLPHPDVAYLLGVLTGDGCLTVRGRTILSSVDAEILDRVQQTAKTYLDGTFKKTSSRPYDYELGSVEAKALLRRWGLTETYAAGKTVSKWVLAAPRPYVEAYVRGLFDTDGTIDSRGAVSFSSASEILVTEVQALLLNLGVVTRRYERTKRYNGKKQFYITVYGDFVERFRDTIGFSVARKTERLAAVCERQRNTNINVIPARQHAIASVWQAARKETATVLDRAWYGKNLYKNTKRYISGERNPSPAGLMTFVAGMETLAPAIANTEGVQHLRRLASGQFFFTRVSKIEDGRARVYDLTVPHLHNFVANGLVNHNTLLARAVAGEAGVPFFTISGSEFVEMFVGVGASRVRDLFQLAKKAAPAIIFVDEIDAVGRVRGSGIGGGNDEREQTLNQILVELDGFEPNEKVIVMAATNRPDVLDPALLRPGRFDRRVTIDLPDREDRIAILGIHARKKPLAEDVDLSVIAQRTPGFSGADLYSLMNEGAILAAREERKKVAQFDLIRSIEKVMLGPERKSHVLSKREREITAYHEAGHALVSSVLPYADPVQKISIISRGRAAGYTLKLPDQDRRMQSRKEFLDDIASSLGGYVAEEMIFDDLTTGPSNDLQVLTGLARDMVTKYGMSEAFGPMALEGMGGRLIGGGMSEDRGYGDTVAERIDAEVKKIIDEARSQAKEILVRYRVALDAVATRLIVVEALEREEYEAILKAQGVEVKDYYRDLDLAGVPLPKGDPTKVLEPDSDVLA
jgi:ATP-dependent metalloprotease FtsH